MGLKDLFGKNPEKETMVLFETLLREMIKIRIAFGECGEAALKNNFNAVKEKALEISHIEHKADDIRRQIGQHLYKGAFMPVVRSRLYELADGLDEIFDSVRDTANTFIYLQNRKLSNKVKNKYRPRVGEACEGIAVFEKVVKGFFSGQKDIVANIKKANEREHNLDVLKKDIFDEMLLGKKQDAVTVWIVTDIASLISSIGDAIEECCDKIAVLKLIRIE